MTSEQQQAFEQQAFQDMLRQQQQAAEVQRLRAMAQAQAARTQAEINAQKKQRYAVIVAVDEKGTFAKDGKIPWHYPDDLRWFQTQTKGHICVMGRATYDDLIQLLGDKAGDSILEGRRCFVVTSSPESVTKATPVPSISAVDSHVSFDDIDNDVVVFFIGGERIYSEGIAKADTAYVTVVNTDAEGDRSFPTQYLMTNFALSKVFTVETSPDLRFTIWERNK